MHSIAKINEELILLDSTGSKEFIHHTSIFDFRFSTSNQRCIHETTMDGVCTGNVHGTRPHKPDAGGTLSPRRVLHGIVSKQISNRHPIQAGHHYLH